MLGQSRAPHRQRLQHGNTAGNIADLGMVSVGHGHGHDRDHAVEQWSARLDLPSRGGGSPVVGSVNVVDAVFSDVLPSKTTVA